MERDRRIGQVAELSVVCDKPPQSAIRDEVLAQSRKAQKAPCEIHRKYMGTAQTAPHATE